MRMGLSHFSNLFRHHPAGRELVFYLCLVDSHWCFFGFEAAADFYFLNKKIVAYYWPELDPLPLVHLFSIKSSTFFFGAIILIEN